MPEAFIKLYKVKSGDCIQVRWYDDKAYRNIIIDCGYGNTFNQTLGPEIKRLKSNGEFIDLLILTHTHQDHIGGMKKIISSKNDDIIKHCWFNGGRVNMNLDNSNKISISKGIELDEYLISKGIGNTEKIMYDNKIYNIYGANIKILSPRKEALEEFLLKFQEKIILKNNKTTTSFCDWDIELEDFNLDEFYADAELENRISISFIMEIKNKKILFLADSHPDEIAKSLKKLGYNVRNRLYVDYIKLSHHASKGNTSNELLDLIKCNNFIISTDGANKDKFPHKETFARILRHPLRNIDEKIKFIFNYDTPSLLNIFSNDDYGKYNFECIYPERGKNNVKISI